MSSATVGTVEGSKTQGQVRKRRTIRKSQDAFRTIGEASGELELKPHVLRFWETKFTQLAPMKRADGRRYYRPSDMMLLRVLKHLLHEQCMTIKEAGEFLGTQEARVLLKGMTGPSVQDLQDALSIAFAGHALVGGSADSSPGHEVKVYVGIDRVAGQLIETEPG